MTIQPLTNKTNNIVLPAKPTATGKENNISSKETERSKDSIDITVVAKEITKAFESSKNTSIIDEDRVNAVRKALDEGTYPINAEKIAEKMIQIERQQYIDSR